MADWQAGDLALCVRRVHSRASAQTGVRQGVVYLVTSVVMAPDGRIGLRLAGCAARPYAKLRAFPASGFVKITPGTEIEGFEEPRRVPVKEDA